MLLLSMIAVAGGLGVLGSGSPSEDCPQVLSVRIVSRVGDASSADNSRKYAKAGENVTLYAVVVASGPDGSQVFTAAPLPDGTTRTPAQWPTQCPLSLSWYKVEAEAQSYWNPGNTRQASLAYRETPWTTGWSAESDVHPTLMHDQFKDVRHGFGVMRFKVVAQIGTSKAASPGTECLGTGAVCQEVHTVTYRKDDTYIGYLHELFNTPYIYGSRYIRGGHQADLLLGSDCADFVVYGKRRQFGPKKFEYTCSAGLCRYGSECLTITLDDTFQFVDRKGQKVQFGVGKRVRPGDAFVMEGGHVGVLVEDNGNGLLDSRDLVMHTLKREPEIVPLEECRWGVQRGRVVRWKE